MTNNNTPVLTDPEFAAEMLVEIRDQLVARRDYHQALADKHGFDFSVLFNGLNAGIAAFDASLAEFSR